jgi:hypothetical protein
MNGITRHLDAFTIRLESMPALLLLLLAATGVGIAFWYYRNPSPPVSAGLRRFLFILRACALALLFFALAEPALNLVISVTRTSRTVVLLDTSSSMDQALDPGRKREALEALGAVRSRVGARGLFLAFDTSIRSLSSGEPLFDGSATDIAAALRHADAEKDVSDIVLISDGRWNLGENPVSAGLAEPVPVHTVLAGSASSVPDIILRSVSAAPVGRDGGALTVEITVAASGRVSGSVPVDISERGRALVSGKAVLGEGGAARLSLDLPLLGIGAHTFTVKLTPPFADRMENNARTFTVRVLKSRFAVLLIAPIPSPDLAFVRRAIESDSSFTVSAALSAGIAGADAAFPDRLELFDAVIVFDGGGGMLTPERVRLLSSWLSKGKGLWVIGSTPPPADSEFEGLLPVIFDRTAGAAKPGGAIVLTDDGRSHFITAAGVDREVWSMLPPLQSFAVTKPTPEGRVLAVISGVSGKGNPSPAVVAGARGKGRTVVVPISGVWRWRLMMEGAEKGGGFFDSFVRGTVRWLTSEIEASPLAVTTDAGSYLSGQDVRFEARVFDTVYMPISGAEVILTVDNNPALKAVLDETQPGLYTGSLRSLPPGRHTFSASASVEGRRYADATGTFEVERFSLELLDPSPDPESMAAIAANTGGIAVTAAGIDSALSRISLRTVTEREERDHRLAFNPILPSLVILLLAVEWFIRKRRGMI